MALGGAVGPGLVARDAAALCVAGVALGDIHLRFTWQAWRTLTSTVVLRGRRGAHGTVVLRGRHNCVGFLFLILYPGSLPRLPPPPLSHTITSHTQA